MELFDRDLVFVSKRNSKEEVFEDLYENLREKDLVTEDFLKMIIEREENYPTGLDMSVIENVNYNIAVPHTESYAVKTTKIVPIKLDQEIVFNNMIDVESKIKVKFLFVILNKNGSEQADLLAKIMDFVTQTKNINDLFELDSEDDIYDFILENFEK